MKQKLSMNNNDISGKLTLFVIGCILGAAIVLLAIGGIQCIDW